MSSQKIIIRKCVGNQLTKGWQLLSHIQQRICSMQLPCPVCRRADANPVLSLVGGRKSPHRDFVDLLNRWSRKYQGKLKTSLSIDTKHLFLSCGELAKQWLEGGHISGPSLP